jgi:tetratricopeptide (TPR) repeat protein
MRVFLSYSSSDRTLVEEVWRKLGPQVAWIDRVEIDVGDIILEKVAEGIEEATDFLLFWSINASRSQWVKLELHMGFLRWIDQKGCKLRVITLDKTSLPLYLRPFLYMDVSKDISLAPDAIVKKLQADRSKPRDTVRRLFVDRHEEQRRIELATDSQEAHIILLQGLPGIGKRTLLSRALETLFSRPDLRAVTVRPGTEWVELALQLCAFAGISPPEDGTNQTDVEKRLIEAIETLHSSGVILVFYEIQYWLDEEGVPLPLLVKLLEWFSADKAFASRPVFMTSTRIPALYFEQKKKIQTIRIQGIADEHLTALIRHWVAIEKGLVDIEQAKLNTLSSELYGYPLAARFAASLISHYGLDALLEHPLEMRELRIDIAKDLMTYARVSDDGVCILQALSALDAPIPNKYVAEALNLSPEQFRESIESALSFGFLDTDGVFLSIHPLVRDFYWRALAHNPDYLNITKRLAQESLKYLETLKVGSIDYSVLLPTVFRLLAMSGQIKRARELRSDLLGTLLEAAIQLYHRRAYEEALNYVELVLEGNRDNWDARLYKARCLSRLGKPRAAQPILEEMRKERSYSVRVLHESGRAAMAEQQWETALDWFAKALAERPDDLPSLRDSAECYLRLKDLKNAEGFVKVALEIEPRNAYLLATESRVLEEKGLLGEAYEKMTIAKRQDPQNASFTHRLGRIAEQQGDRPLALEHYNEAVQLDERFTEARLSRASVLIDLNRIEDAEEEIAKLQKDVHEADARRVLTGIEAKLLLAKNKLDDAMKLIRYATDASSYGLKVKIEIARAEDYRQQGYQGLHDKALAEARKYVEEGLKLHPDNEQLLELKSRFSS